MTKQRGPSRAVFMFCFMNSPFFAAFNKSIPIAERVMGEPWQFSGVEYTALVIEKMGVQERAQPGGRFHDASATITVSNAVFTNAAVKEGSVISAYGEFMRILRIEADGDAAKTLVCGPVGPQFSK